MPGVIALLDPEHSARVEALWRDMERLFGVPYGYPGAIPHISFHISNHDLEPGAADVVREVARASAPLTVYSAGLGVFSGPPPVVHLAAARSPEVVALADALATRLEAAGFPSTDPYFTPERWMPHITIAHKNLEGLELGPPLAWLAQQPLAWEIPLVSISVARETEAGADILATFPLGG